MSRRHCNPQARVVSDRSLWTGNANIAETGIGIDNLGMPCRVSEQKQTDASVLSFGLADGAFQCPIQAFVPCALRLARYEPLRRVRVYLNATLATTSTTRIPSRARYRTSSKCASSLWPSIPITAQQQ
jgi:hypothetical protein